MREITARLVRDGELHKLNANEFPGCHLYRSDPNDVARVEHVTFVCTRSKEDAGPNNHWMAPAEAHAKMRALFSGCMRGRTLYVVPYCMGPLDSPYARCGVEITDSAYVVLNMAIMTRMGRAALERIARDGSFVRGLHSTGELDPSAPLHHALPGRAAHRELRLGLRRQRTAGQEVPCAAHRQLAGAQGRLAGRAHAHRRAADPKGETHYIAAAFPSACGKTNLAMLIPPDSMPGWKVFTVGDDIAWLHPGPDGRLWAINPEAGYFGVAPGTNPRDQPQRLRDDPARHAVHERGADGRQ